MSMRTIGNRGFIQLIVLLVILLIVLGAFGLNIENILKAPMVQNNLNYFWKLAVAFWNNFFATPFAWIVGKLHGFISFIK